MAHHLSAKKRIRRNEKRRVINHARISRVRTFVKRVESAIALGNQDAAKDALKLAQPEMHRGVSRGVLHKNTVSRKISRLSKRIKSMAA
jgi:small subunit ribosomal protein S20